MLSDHGGDQLHQSELRLRDAADDEAAWQQRYVAHREELAAASRDKPLWKRLLSVSTMQERLARQRVEDAASVVEWKQHSMVHAHDEVPQRDAGVQGEELMAGSLSTLPDEWVLLRGYRNRRGETDLVLVGPAGMWAIEVKRRRVLLHAVGEQWVVGADEFAGSGA